MHTLNTGPRARGFVLSTEGRFWKILGLWLHIGAQGWRGPNKMCPWLGWLVHFRQEGADPVGPLGHCRAAPPPWSPGPWIQIANPDGLVNLKNKNARYFTSRNTFVQEQQRIAIQDQQGRARPQVRPQNKATEHFYRGKGELGRTVLNQVLWSQQS